MAIPFLNNINLDDNQLQNAKLHVTSSAPAAEEGQIYFHSTNDVVNVHDGSGWKTLAYQSWVTSNYPGTVTSVNLTAGNLIDVSGGPVTSSGSITVNVDLSELTDMTQTMLSTDEFVVLDSGSQKRKAASEIGLSIFNNDSGFTTNTGTVTSVAIAGTDGIDVDSGSPVTSSGTITLGLSNIPNASLANDSITLGNITVALGASTTTLTGLTDIDLTAGNKTIFDGVGANNLTIGAGTTTVIIPGDLQVTGTVTTNNVETVSTSNGVIFEGNAADANELTLLAGTLTADRTVTLPDATGTVALTSDINDATLTVQGNNGLTGSGTFTANDADATTITLSHADTSSQASVNNSGRTYIQDITLDTYGHITGITSATETVTDTNTQLATAAALIDVSAMGSNTTASFTHSLASKNLIVQLYDVTTGEVVFADIDHTSNNAISVIFASTPTNDIRVVVIDAKNGLTDKTVTYS